jgi:hypothetical protein
LPLFPKYPLQLCLTDYRKHGRVWCDACVCCAVLSGSALNGFWSKQKLYNPVIKPHKTGLANMLDADPLFIANRAAETNSFTLRLGQLITDGAKVCANTSYFMCCAHQTHMAQAVVVRCPPEPVASLWLTDMWIVLAHSTPCTACRVTVCHMVACGGFGMSAGSC